ncbi:MAG: glycosyltransferase, partial [Paludibacter sp.]|nr:glycosyltransferase [Paludibacter sp.]
HNDVEYIIVDGLSTDGSMDIINRYRDRIDKIISEKDSGMYEAINKGIRICTGDIVGLMHSDDQFSTPRVLSAIANTFEKTNADIVYANGLFVSPDQGNTVRKWHSGNYSRSKIKHGWLPLHTTVYVKKIVFDLCGLYNESYRIAADSDMQVRLFYVHDFKVHFMDKYIVKMNMGGLSTSIHTLYRKFFEDYRMYRSHGFVPVTSMSLKIISKIPQFARGFAHRINEIYV